MATGLDLIRRHPLRAFFALACILSWSYWIPVAVGGGHLSHFPGLLGPMISAFVVTGIVDGRDGAGNLLARMLRWRVPIRWYLAALVPALVGGAAVVAGAIAGDGWPSGESLSTMPGLPSLGLPGLFAAVFFVNGYGEEVGWRGFAWPRLREGRRFTRAALVLWFWWAVWHVPVFWLETGLADKEWYVAPAWLLGLAAGAVVLGWLYERSESSVLVVALFHTLLSMSSATPATEGLPAAAPTTVIMLWAVIILRHPDHNR